MDVLECCRLHCRVKIQLLRLQTCGGERQIQRNEMHGGGIWVLQEAQKAKGNVLFGSHAAFVERACNSLCMASQSTSCCSRSSTEGLLFFTAEPFACNASSLACLRLYSSSTRMASIKPWMRLASPICSGTRRQERAWAVGDACHLVAKWRKRLEREGRRKKEEGRRKKEEGRRKKEEGRRTNGPTKYKQQCRPLPASA